MTGLDYSAWIARARAFTGGIARLPGVETQSSSVLPPASAQDVDAVERTLGSRLPAALRAFLTRGAAGLDCRYIMEPVGQVRDRLQELLPDEKRIYGGARIAPLSDLPALAAGVAEWARDTWVADEDAQRVIWEASFPFLQLDNGDYLALDLRNETDPPMVYLNHDDESVTIAPGFDEFLRAWEGLCYLGPEHWLLLEFLGGDGYLDANGDRAARLRGLFER